MICAPSLKDTISIKVGLTGRLQPRSYNVENSCQLQISNPYEPLLYVYSARRTPKPGTREDFCVGEKA